MFWLFNDGGWAPTHPVSLLCRAIQSLVGHAVWIVSDSNMLQGSS